MSDEIRVRDRKTGNIRTVTRKAYMAMGPKVYEKLGDEPAMTTVTRNVHRTVSAPVIRPQIQESEPEQTEVQGVEVKTEKKKPGRPKKEISSASDDAEK